MAWIEFTTDHVKARLTKDEVDGYIVAGGQFRDGTDSLDAIVEQTVGLVRGKVASNRDNLPKMGAAGTIPAECLFAASTIARDALCGSLPLSDAATEVRKDELRRAHEYLDAVAKGDVRIEDEAGGFSDYTPATSTDPTYGGATLLEF